MPSDDVEDFVQAALSKHADIVAEQENGAVDQLCRRRAPPGGCSPTLMSGAQTWRAPI
jgi:hypothetical protein